MTSREANELMNLHPDQAEAYIRNLDHDSAIDLANDLAYTAHIALAHSIFAREWARAAAQEGLWPAGSIHHPDRPPQPQGTLTQPSHGGGGSPS